MADRLRPSIAIGSAGDTLEQQADRAADTISAGGRASGLHPAPVKVQRVSASERAGGGNGQRAADAVAAGGQAMPSPLRSYFEPRFGADLAGVRLHTDAPAATAANAIGARAYTYGNDIAFAPGAYAPGTASGRRLIAHELAHVLQQRSGALRIQRDGPQTAKPADAELELGNTLRGPGFSNGFALAFYDENEPEAQRRAADFATRENAIGLKGTGIDAANLVFGKAIPSVRTIDATVPAIAKVVNDALARVPAPANYPPATAAAPGKVRAIAIFAHGTPQWCSAGLTVGNAGAVFKKIAPSLSPTVRVVLYTCSSARGTDEEEDWVKGTMRSGGKGSLASLVRDTLADEKIDAGSVWGHTTVGHTSRNFALRVFETRAGKGAEGESYAAKFVFGGLRAGVIAELATEINAQGYSVATSDAGFVAAASAELEVVFYRAYSAANRDLPGDNAAEDAPLYSYYTADRIETYWKDLFWPANRAATVAALIRRLKLKKPKPVGGP
ncbi:DUF4157 domain-containing protein [Kaistia granuli]|uniref:eCIS core domain-containing protein n=1 Tax=Kaistia granuli TaxID=363259 RepID=UPI0003733E67|nr:DUF4157 domain-containing protein [Kaistia granuli]